MNSERKGPWEVFPFGKYKGKTLREIIREDPQYVGYCVKQYLNLSMEQAVEFENLTDVQVPEEYIDYGYKVSSPKPSPVQEEKSPTKEMSSLEYSRWACGMDIQPNYNFDNEKWE